MNEPELRFKADDGSEFPEWKHAILGELGQVSMCKRIFKDQTTNDGEIPFYKIGTFGGKADAFISRELFEEYKKKYPYPEIGNILISASGSIGRTVEYTGADEYFQDSNIVWLAHDGRVLDGYLKCFYSITNWNGVEGSTIKRLYNKIILDTSINLPCIEEQQKITDLFSTLDNVIDFAQKEVDSWGQMKRGVMQKLFSQEVRFKADDGTEFPEWRKEKLGDIFKERNERSKGSEKLLSVTIASGVIQQSDSDKRNIASSDTSNYKIIHKGDLAYNTMRMWQGAEGVSDYDGIISPAYTVLICNENNEAKFFADMFKLKYMLYQFEKHSQGLTSDTWKLKYKHFSEIQVEVPCLEEQQKIVDCLSEFDSVIEKTKQKLEAYKQLKKGLMQRMFV